MEIENLSIQISANARDAIAEIEKLASALGKFNRASRSAADSARDFGDAAQDAGTQSQEAGEAVGRFSVSLQPIKDRLKSILSPLKFTGNEFKALGKAAMGAVGGVFSFVGGIARIAKYRMIRSIIKDLGQSFKDLYGYSDAFGIRFADSMDKITTATTYLRNSIAAMVAPIVNALAPAIDYIIDKIVEWLNWLNELFAALNGQKTFTVARKVAADFGDTLGGTAKKAKKAADEIKRTILGFDEINKLTKPKEPSTSSSSGSSPYSNNYKTMFEERTVGSGFTGFSDSIVNAVNDTVSRIALIISGASLAVGAILAFSGANIPVGIGLMAAGALGIAATLDWSFLDRETYNSLKRIMGIVSLGFLGVGAILAFSGVNVPLGIALMAAGTYGAIKSVDWDSLSKETYNAIKKVIGVTSIGALGIGAVLAFSGVNVPLGIGLIAAGIAGAVATLNWDTMGNETYNALKKVIATVSLGAVGIGAILALTGVNIPLGIALLAGGIAGAAATVDWNALGDKVAGAWNDVVAKTTLAWRALTTIVGNAWEAMKQSATEKVETIKNVVVTAWSGITTWTTATWNSIKNFVANTWDWLSSNVTGAFDTIKNVVVAAWSGITTWTTSMWNAIKNFATNIWNGLTSKATEIFGNIKNAVVNAWSSVTTWTTSTWNSLKNNVANIWNNIKTNASTTFTNITNNIKDAWSNIQRSFASFVSWIRNGFWSDWGTAWSGIVEHFGKVFAKIKDKVKDPINAVIRFLNKLISKVESAINKIVSGINSALSISIPAIGFWDPWGNWRGTAAWSWSPNLPGVSWDRINELAHGGILDSPTMLTPNVLAGEAGREAVLPLENHTEWMDTLANRVRNGISGQDGNLAESVRQGMSEAVSRQNDLLREQNRLLQQLLAKDMTVEVTSTAINKAQNRMNKRAGTTIVPVGT